MKTEIIFNSGHRLHVVATNAPTLTQTLARATADRTRLPTGETLALGWTDIQTEEEGVILVNAAQVAYVRDVEDTHAHAAPSLSGVEGQPVSGRL
jgi:hypothetical protein